MALVLDDFKIINMSFLPIWTMMESEYRTGGILGTLDSAEEVIALSYTKALLQRTLQGVRTALQSTKKGSNAGISEAIADLEREVQKVSRAVDESMQEKMVKYSAFLAAKQSLALEVARVKERTAQQLSNINRRTK